MTEAVSETPDDLTATEKSAMVMMLIGQETAAEIVKFLTPPEIDRLSMAMTRITAVPRRTAAAVSREFAELMREDPGLDGGAYVHAVLEKALGADAADRLLGRLNQGVAAPGLDLVKWRDPHDLAALVKTEHPQIIAMIAACLEPEQAQILMQDLPDDLVEQAVPRLARLDALAPSTIQELSQSLEDLLANEPRQARVSLGGVDVAAKILGRLGSTRSGRVLDAIGAVDPELADLLNNRMFVFEDLFEIDDRSFQILLRGLDQKLLIAALKGTPIRLRDKVFANLSQRAAQMLREEIEASAPVRQAEVEDARKQILAAGQTLEREARIILRPEAELT